MPRYIPYMSVDSPEHVAGSLELRKIKNQLDEDLKTLNLTIDPESTPEKRKKAAKKLYSKYNKKRNKFSLNSDKDFEDLYIDPIILIQLHKELGELKDATNELLRKTMLNYANNSFLSPYYLQSPVKSNTLEGALGYFNVAKNATTEPFSTTAFMVSPAFSSLLLGSLGYMASDKVAEDAGLTGTDKKITGIAGGVTTGLLSYLTHGAFKNIRKTLELVDEMKKGPVDVPYTELNSNLIKNTQKYLPANSKIYFLVTGNRPLLSTPKLTSHVLGDEAVKMFKEYGGTKVPENTNIYKLLKSYVPEVRSKYGILNREDITDDEIIESLYKEIISQENITKLGNEPVIGFRGDTKEYTELMPRLTPKELLQKNGTMDNSLGTLFLGEMPHSYELGIDRYLVTGNIIGSFMPNKDFDFSATGSATGANPINVPEGSFSIEDFEKSISPYLQQPPIRNRISLRSKSSMGNVYKVKPQYTSTGVNDINAFMFKGNPRDATYEILVGNGGRVVIPNSKFNLLVDQKPTLDPSDNEGLTYLWGNKKINVLDDTGNETGAIRELMAEHYLNVLEQAQKNNQGLLYSAGISPNANGAHPFRDEHSRYTYLALPNFNIRGAKHILPYDLRIPRDWNDPNIFRFTDRFGKEITPTPYYGSKEELLNSLVNGIIKGIKYRTSPLHIQLILETMGWTDDQMARLSEEFKKLSSNMSIGVSSLEEGMSDIGNYKGGYIKDSNGNIVGFKSDIYGNIDRIPNDAIAMETGAHEMGGHGLTAGIRAEQSNSLDKYFPLIKELMLKNKELARLILVPINNNSWDDAYNYFTDDNELVTRVIADNALGGNTSGFEKLKEYFTPESLQKYKKVVLSLLGVTSVGTAASNNRYGEKLIKRKFK